MNGFDLEQGGDDAGATQRWNAFVVPGSFAEEPPAAGLRAPPPPDRSSWRAPAVASNGRPLPPPRLPPRKRAPGKEPGATACNGAPLATALAGPMPPGSVRVLPGRSRPVLVLVGAITAGALLAVALAGPAPVPVRAKSAHAAASPGPDQANVEPVLAAAEVGGTDETTRPSDSADGSFSGSAPVPVFEGRTSVVRVPASVRGILVDGRPRRVVGGAFFLTCGKHRFKLPWHPSRSVDVPCGRTVSL